MIGNKLIEMLKGPERNFNIVSIEKGDEYFGLYYGATPTWGAGGCSSYTGRTRLRQVTVTLEVEGVHYNIKGDENVGGRFEQSAYRFFPKEVEILQGLVGHTIRTRAKPPYTTETLKKLVKASRGEFR